MLAPRQLLCVIALFALAARCSEAADESAEQAREVLGSISDPQTLSQLLQWSLNHTDLDALHAKAEAVRAKAAAGGGAVLSADGNVGDVRLGDDVASDGTLLPAPSGLPTEPRASVTVEASAKTFSRREELSAAADAMFPNQVELMRRAMHAALNLSLSVDFRERALLALQELVEDLDNARDFMTIGGFKQVMGLLGSDTPELVAATAWLIGTAVQNQRELQLQMLELELMAPLLKLLLGHVEVDVRAKVLFAISCLLRNCPEAQLDFRRGEGVRVLVEALADVSSPRLVRKALVLLTDLLTESAAHERDLGEVRQALEHAPHLCEAVLSGLEMKDLDTQEKAVEALNAMVAAGVAVGGIRASSGEGCTSKTIHAALHRFVAQGADSSEAEGSEEVMALAQQLEAMFSRAEAS